MNDALADITGIQKAAILLIVVGEAAASEIFKNLDEDEIEGLTLEIANLPDIPSSVLEGVLAEFRELIQAREYISKGGMDYASEVLEGALGAQRAAETLNKVQNIMHVTGFRRLRQVPATDLLEVVQAEHPQTMALILVNLKPEQSAAILKELPQEVQQDIIYRIATMERISPEMVDRIEAALESRFETTISGELSALEGTKTAAELLNLSDRATEKRVLAELGTKDPDLATEIKNLMFVFEDIVGLDSKAVIRILQEVEGRDIAMSLKVASEEVKSVVFANVSERVATGIQEEMDFLGPVRLGDVEEAQRKVVDVITDLEERGEIRISKGGAAGDELIG